jgi:hypothetical protein
LAELCSVLTVPRHREEEITITGDTDMVVATDAITVTKESTAGMIITAAADPAECITAEVMIAAR